MVNGNDDAILSLHSNVVAVKYKLYHYHTLRTCTVKTLKVKVSRPHNIEGGNVMSSTKMEHMEL